MFEKGAEWFAKLGTDKSGGTRLVTPVGHGEPPGHRTRCRMQTTFSEPIFADEYGQGLPPGPQGEGA